MRYKQNKFAIMKFAKKRVSEKSIILNRHGKVTKQEKNSNQHIFI